MTTELDPLIISSSVVVADYQTAVAGGPFLGGSGKTNNNKMRRMMQQQQSKEAPDDEVDEVQSDTMGGNQRNPMLPLHQQIQQQQHHQHVRNNSNNSSSNMSLVAVTSGSRGGGGGGHPHPSRQFFYRCDNNKNNSANSDVGLRSSSASSSRDYNNDNNNNVVTTAISAGVEVEPTRSNSHHRDLLDVVTSTRSSDSESTDEDPQLTNNPLGPLGGGGSDGGMMSNNSRGGGGGNNKNNNSNGNLNGLSSSSHTNPPPQLLPIGGLPPPKQLHEEYTHRLHRNQVAQGHHNFVVGGAHGRYRDFGGTLVEVPEEVVAVRQAALTVLEPITYCWLILTVGFSTAAALGVAKFTGKWGSLPYWAIFTPAWTSHAGIVIMQIQSARALSNFISDANDNRQRADSTDHLDRVEYLPLLQRSLKFGFKTGILCFIIFIFEILLFVRLVNPSRISLSTVYIPVWILTLIFICNGIVCKSQHVLHSLIWVLMFTAMLLSVLIADFNIDEITNGHIIVLIIAMLVIVCGVLIHVVHGHQVGYYKLSNPQLNAAVLYSTSSFLALIVAAIMGDAIILPEMIQLDLLVITVLLTPIVVALAGCGAYLVSRDEFDRLLKDGGQSAVVPMRLRLEMNGWTSVQSKGVVTIPMLGEVQYAPLDGETADRLSMECCGPCAEYCYPTEDDDDIPFYNRGGNYKSPTPPNSMAVTARWGGSEAPIV